MQLTSVQSLSWRFGGKINIECTDDPVLKSVFMARCETLLSVWTHHSKNLLKKPQKNKRWLNGDCTDNHQLLLRKPIMWHHLTLWKKETFSGAEKVPFKTEEEINLSKKQLFTFYVYMYGTWILNHSHTLSSRNNQFVFHLFHTYINMINTVVLESK